MKKFVNLSRCTWICLFASFMMLTGCISGTGGSLSDIQPAIPVEKPENVQWPDQSLANRFQMYWNIRKAGNSARLMELEAPHIREMVIPGRYGSFFSRVQTGWVSIRIEKIYPITDLLVGIDFNMITTGGKGMPNTFFYRDYWLYFNNQWVHVIKDPFLTGEGIGKSD